MTYRLVLNDRSIKKLSDDDLRGFLKSKLGYVKFRRVSIQNVYPNATGTKSPVKMAPAPKDIFYLFFENEGQANIAMNVAKTIPIISLTKYKPRPCVGMKHTPATEKQVAREPPVAVGSLPQSVVDIPRTALSRYLDRFADEKTFCDCLRRLCKEILVRRLSTTEIATQVQQLIAWLNNNPQFRVSGQRSAEDLVNIFFHDS